MLNSYIVWYLTHINIGVKIVVQYWYGLSVEGPFFINTN